MHKNKTIVVIGAGIAGLTAAHRLNQAGLNVHLYEARNRVGGRIFTIKIHEHIAELGAQNIKDGGEATHLHRLIEEFGLHIHTSPINLNHHYFNGNDLTPISQLIKNKKFDPESLRFQLDRLASKARNMKEIINHILDENEPLYKNISARLTAYEGASLEELSPIYANTLFHMLLGGICSVHQGNVDEQDNYVQLASIEGGNGLLPEKIAATLGDRLHLNMPLNKIGKDREGLFNLTFGNGQKIKCDILILAIPCSIYKTIIFEEEVISAQKLENIRKIQYGMNAKIMIPFSNILKGRIGLVGDQILCFFDISQKILTVYFSGQASLFTKDSILTAFSKARPMIEKGFGDAFPSMKEPQYAEDQSFIKYDTLIGYSWPNDLFARGSYSYVSPGQEPLLTNLSEENGEKFKSLFVPFQNLYFAGEHATILLEIPGTMEAACESGERIARVILKQENISSFWKT